MIEQLKQIKRTSYGAISMSKNRGSKYFELRKWILDRTNFLPNDSKISDRIYCILNDVDDWPLCDCGCKKPVNKVTSKFLPSHGNRSQSVKDKKIQTCIENFGVENPSQSIEINNRKKETFQKNFGTDHFMKNPSAYDSFKKNMIEKIGVENPFQLEEVKQIIAEKWDMNKEEILFKRSETAKVNFFNSLIEGNRLNGEVEPLFKIEEYQGIDSQYKFKCKHCDDVFYSNLDDGKIPRCFQCYPNLTKLGTSNIEQELFNFVKGLDPLVKLGDRSLIHPFEVDVISYDKKICIELNGLYWHSDLNGKSRQYHLNKTQKCNKKGYRLIHIFEDEWMQQKDIVKKRLRNIFGGEQERIFARKCEVKEISPKIKNLFLNDFHIQGEDRSTIKLGLFYERELVSVMTFRNDSRVALGKNVTGQNNWELVRFCSGHYHVVGGAGKLLSYFKKNYEWNEICTYADLRWSEGNLYDKLGFEFSHQSPPNYWYLDSSWNREHRYKYAKHNLPNVLDMFDPNLSEWQNMQNNGYDRIWDCGNLVYKLKK